MSHNKFEKVKQRVSKDISNYDKYVKLNDELIIKITNKEDSVAITEGINELEILKIDILKNINNILYEKGLEVKIDNIERGIDVISAFTLDDNYFNNEELPKSINDKLKDDYYDDCFNGYKMILEFVKRRLIRKEDIYDVLGSSYIFLYDLMLEVYKENGITGLAKYIKIIELFKKQFKTSIASVNIDERFKKYVLLLTSNNNFMNSLNVYDLYLIMLCFGNNEFLDKVISTNGKIVEDIATLIIRRKKDGMSKEDEAKQLKQISNNLNLIPSYEEKNIKL